MKRYGYIFMMIAIALILTACGGKESKEDVINSIEENIDEVEKYYTEMDLNVTAYINDDVVDQSEGILKVRMNESTLESSGESVQDADKMEYYSTEEATYAQMNDSGWEDMTAQEDNFKLLESDYKSIAQIVIDLKDEEDFEMEEKDGKFVFSFKGKSEEVYKALEDPYTLTLDGAETKDMEHDLIITVDSETYFVEELKTDMTVEKDDEKLEISITHIYDEINEIDDVEIPQEVIDEAAAEEATNDAGGDEEKDEGKDENNTTDAENADLEQRVFEAEDMGLTTTITYYHKGDKVIKQTAENVVPYEAVGVTTKEEAQEIFEPEAEKFQGVDGIKHEMEYNDTEAVETLEVDYENLDFDKASELPGMMFDGNAKENGVSMKQSAEMLLNQGFVEK